MALGMVVVPGTALASTTAKTSTSPGVSAGDSARAGNLPSEREIQQAREALQALDGDPDHPAVESARAPSGLASKFAVAFFTGILKKGGEFSLASILKILGFDGNEDLTRALSEINDSMQELNADVQKIHEQIEALLHEVDRQNYYQAYSRSAQSVTDIDTEMRRATGWIANGVEPSDVVLGNSQTVLAGAIGQLAANTTDATTGTIAMMMKSGETSRTSDLVAYWADIDAARDDYRASLAQGLAALDLMTRWDRDGSIKSDLQTLTPVAADAVLGMYEYGSDVPQAEGELRYVNTRDSDELLASTQYPGGGSHGWKGVATTQSNLEERLQAMAEHYAPRSKSAPATLQEYLQDAGLPTVFDYGDTYIRTYQLIPGPRGTSPRTYQSIKSTEGYLDGNTYRTREVTRVEEQINEPENEMENLKNELAAQASQPTLQRAKVSSNVAGRAADLDPDRARDRAYGDTSSWADATPVAVGSYYITSPLAGPVAVAPDPRTDYPLVGTDNNGLSGEVFHVEAVGDDQVVLRSTTRGYVKVTHATLRGGATLDDAHRFEMRSSNDGRTWIKSVLWDPYIFWVGQDPERSSRDEILIKGDTQNPYDGYADDHFFTLTPA